MKKDTEIYSSFIKANSDKIKVLRNGFSINGIYHSLKQDYQGWWVDGDQEVYLTKKSAIYFTAKNNHHG